MYTVYVQVFIIDTMKKKTIYWMVRHDFYVCEVFSKLLPKLGHVKVIYNQIWRQLVVSSYTSLLV